MAIIKIKTMTVHKQLSLATLAGGSGLNDADLATATSVAIIGDAAGGALKFDLADVTTGPTGGVTTIKKPELYIPISQLASTFSSIWSALGGELKGVFIAAGNITFIGKEQDFS